LVGMEGVEMIAGMACLPQSLQDAIQEVPVAQPGSFLLEFQKAVTRVDLTSGLVVPVRGSLVSILGPFVRKGKLLKST